MGMSDAAAGDSVDQNRGLDSYSLVAISQALYDTLTRVDPKTFEPTPWLAEEFTAALTEVCTSLAMQLLADAGLPEDAVVFCTYEGVRATARNAVEASLVARIARLARAGMVDPATGGRYTAEAFRAAYRREPDSSAATSYDAVHLLSVARWPLHYTFVRERIYLEPPLDRCDPEQNSQFNAGWTEFSRLEYYRVEGRRFLLGTLARHASTGLASVEYTSGDVISAGIDGSCGNTHSKSAPARPYPVRSRRTRRAGLQRSISSSSNWRWNTACQPSAASVSAMASVAVTIDRLEALARQHLDGIGIPVLAGGFVLEQRVLDDPIVDAAMRQLAASGWMHNRARMIAASFLIKHLLIDWREGERWFWDTLVDADLANNTQGWQWTAGTGADAAPYFRIFSPIAQAKMTIAPNPAIQPASRPMTTLILIPPIDRLSRLSPMNACATHFAAEPYPVMAAFTSLGVCSATGSPRRAAAAMTTPLT